MVGFYASILGSVLLGFWLPVPTVVRGLACQWLVAMLSLASFYLLARAVSAVAGIEVPRFGEIIGPREP